MFVWRYYDKSMEHILFGRIKNTHTHISGALDDAISKRVQYSHGFGEMELHFDMITAQISNDSRDNTKVLGGLEVDEKRIRML